MSKLTKNKKLALEKIEDGRAYTIEEAAQLVKEITFTKFDASVDIDVRLGVDPRKANQMVRGVVTLPHGTGKDIRVLVLCTPDKVEEAKAAGVLVAGTGRSDAPNQVNNVCVFPGIFRGALAVRASAITEEMKVAAVRAIAGLIPEDELREDYVVPGAFDRRIVPAIAGAVAKVAMSAGIARLKREVQDIEKEAAERVLHNWNA